VVALVGLQEDASVHLTTNIVGCDPANVSIGMPVRVSFEHQGDVWIPLFEPDPDSETFPIEADGVPTSPQRSDRAPAAKFESRVVLSGIGMSPVGRRLLVDPIELTSAACLRAIEDAGISASEIDGISTYPGPQGGGMTEGGIGPLEQALRLQPTWVNGGFDLPGQLGSVVAAMLAVAAGLCRHVLCYRTVWQSTEQELARRGQRGPDEGLTIWGSEWRAPYGATKALNMLAARANRYFHEFGATRELLGWIAINGRRHAALNPDAIYRELLSMDDYLAAPILSTPFGLLDCDVLCDGAVAIIVSARECAADLRHSPTYVEAVGTRITEPIAWDQGTMTHEPQMFGPAAHLWSRTALRPRDVDVAELYDGFSFNAVSWLEALGFCEVGEAQDFVGNGLEIGLEGSLPLNTHGGQLSAGRLHGFGFLHEAILQLRGGLGSRQVLGAEVAVVSSGGLQPAGAMLLTKDPL
jgi:acetyl-CoA acetyltransferase